MYQFTLYIHLKKTHCVASSYIPVSFVSETDRDCTSEGYSFIENDWLSLSPLLCISQS